MFGNAFKILVQCNVDVEGFHYWKDAPTDVAYLRERHRHIFNIKVWIKVKSKDREIEINKTQTAIKEHLTKMYGDEHSRCEFGNMSCEMIAEEIAKTNDFIFAVQVLEDGYGGAVIVRE